MTDKVQKIREEVVRLQNELIQEKEKGFGSDTDDACILELQNVLTYIDSLQEEPVSEELKEAAEEYVTKEGYLAGLHYNSMVRSFKAGAKWQREKDESTTEDLGEYINELSKQFPEVSFAKLSRIAVRVAKWQKEQMMAKAIDGIARPNDNEIWCNLASVNLEDGDKVKVIVIKED